MPNASPRYSPVGSKPAVKSNDDSHSTRNTPPAAAFFATGALACCGRALAVVASTVMLATATATTMAVNRRFLTGRSSLVGAGGGPGRAYSELDVERANLTVASGFSAFRSRVE